MDSSDLDQKTGYEDSLVQTKSILAVSRVLIMWPKMQLRSQLDWQGGLRPVHAGRVRPSSSFLPGLTSFIVIIIYNHNNSLSIKAILLSGKIIKKKKKKKKRFWRSKGWYIFFSAMPLFLNFRMMVVSIEGGQHVC